MSNLSLRSWRLREPTSCILRSVNRGAGWQEAQTEVAWLEKGLAATGGFAEVAILEVRAGLWLHGVQVSVDGLGIGLGHFGEQDVVEASADGGLRVGADAEEHGGRRLVGQE